MIAIEHDGRTLDVPVWIIPGHAKDSITVSVGYGRTRAGRIGNGTGFNTYALRGSAAPFFGAATITPTGDDYDLVGTQDHWSIEGRNILRSATLEEFKAEPDVRQGDGARRPRTASASRSTPTRNTAASSGAWRST